MCIIRKIPTPESDNTLLIEGILESCDASSGHLILAQAIIVKVHGDPLNKYSRRKLIRRAERACIAMDEVKELRFQDLMIDRNGVHLEESLEEQVPQSNSEWDGF